MNLTIENVEIWIGVAVAVLGLVAWALKKWKALNADGKITLDEVLDSVKEGADKAEDVKEQIEDAIEETKE